MEKLERLIQTESGRLHRWGNKIIAQRNVLLVGKITTLAVPSPCLDISEYMDELAHRDSAFIPTLANAYVASDFSCDTQHIRELKGLGVKKIYSIFAIQFYRINE
nr:hypothetical protein [Nanoarchaeum sp.]